MAVENIKRIFPVVRFVVQNSYSAPSDFYVLGKALQTLEGTIQGDPIIMAMYGVTTLPLLRFVQNMLVLQKWYADDGSAVRRLETDLLLFFLQLTEHGSCFGYTVNAPKCQVIVKKASKIKASKFFEGTAVEFVDGCLVLGCVIGNENAYETFKVNTAGKYGNSLKNGQFVKTSRQNA